jgi:hypothetical protein
MAVVLGLALGGAAVRGADSAANEGGLIGRIHFAGTAQIIADPNAAKLNEIRALPESVALWEEIVGKLATTPFRVMNQNSTPRKDDHAIQLRPLVGDVLGAESYWEIRGTTNAWPEVVLAVKLDDAHASIWRTNLATVLADWTGTAVKEIEAEGYKGWELRKHHSPSVFRFVHAKDWVVFGWGDDELALQPAILKKIKNAKRPVAEEKAYWLDAWLDWPKLTGGRPGPLPFTLPKMNLTIAGKKDYVRPEVKMQFAEPLGLKLEPWKIPTNTIYDPLCSLTLARGFGPLLSRVPELKNLSSDPLPNQFEAWSMQGIPFASWMMLPMKNAPGYLQKIAPGLVTSMNRDLRARNAAGTAELTTNLDIAIRGLPILVPRLTTAKEATGDYLMGWLMGLPAKGQPFPWNSILETVKPDNVVYYDWEMNGERMSQWQSLSQLFFMSVARTLPRTDTPAQNWLKAVKPKLENCGTVVKLTAPDELTLVRNAPVGLTGLELNWASLWLDGPEFPLGFKVSEQGAFNPGDVAPGK